MPAKKRATKRTRVDRDAAPPWTDEQFERAEIAVGGKVIRKARGTLTRGPGRPKALHPKKVISLRVDPDVLAAFKASGRGWQTRMNAALARAAKNLRTRRAD
jgi:uncharacterized protein (DUF4415 family)